MTAGISMYKLVISLLDRKPFAWFGGLCAALFYILNPFFAYTFNWNPSYPLAIALLPLAMVAYLQAHRRQHIHTLLIPLTSILILAFAAPVGGNIALYGLVIFIFFTFMISVNLIYKLHSHKIFIIFIFGFLIINIWWLLPMITQYSNVFGGTELYEGALTDTLINSPASKSFRLLLYYWLDKLWQGIPDSPLYPYAQTYFQVFGTLSLFGISFLAFFVLILRRKPKMAYYFLILSIISLFLGQGSNSSIGQFYRWLLINIPGFVAYRSSDIKFPLATMIGYSGLLGISITSISTNLVTKSKKNNRWFFGFILCGGIIVIAGILFIGNPVLRGEIVRLSAGKFPGSRMNPIPTYWKDTAELLDSQPGIDRVLTLPRNGILPDSYSWGYYGTNLLARISQRSVISAGPYIDGYSSQEKKFHQVATILYDSYEQGDENLFLEMINLFNVGYIIYRNDLDPMINWGGDEPQFEESWTDLSSLQDLSHLRTLGDLDLFKVDNGLPRIFASSIGNDPQSNCNEIATILDQKDGKLLPAPTTFSSNNNNFPFKCLINESSSASIEFHRINPTRYNIDVNSQEDFWLVFSESFHPDWKAYIIENRSAENKTWYEWSALLTWIFERDQRRELTDHYQVNAYANGWYVSNTGKYSITLEFTPQRSFEFGIIISSFTFIACFVYLAGDWVRRRTN
jgi:hypothetical protein